MPTFTTNYDFSLPLVNDPTDEDLWGNELNDNFSSLDSLLFTATNAVKRVVVADDTATIDDRNKILLCDATAGFFTQTLPSAATVGDGFTIAFVKTDATGNQISVTTGGSDTIGTITNFYLLSSQNAGLTLVSDGVSNWNYSAILNISVPDASTSVKGIVQLATDAEAKAGSSTTKALTPSNFTASKSTNGYIWIAGGILLQWGEDTTAIGETTRTITFPTGFPNACLNVSLTGRNPTSSITLNDSPQLVSFVTNAFVYFNQNMAGAANNAGIQWMAIGY